MFECLCPGALALTWGLNGVFLAEDWFPPNVTRVAALGDSPARLIIPATPQYNNTVVQCRAFIFEGGGSLRSVLSNNGTLRVQGMDRFQFMGKSHCILITIDVTPEVHFLMYPTFTFCLSYHQQPQYLSLGTLPSP